MQIGKAMIAVFIATIGMSAAAQATALAAGDANEARCNSQTESSPGFRTYLPDCRAYELVTPPYKAGGLVLNEPGAISAGGTQVVVGAGGAFDGVGNDWYSTKRNRDATTYELTRTAGGWLPTALTPPASECSHSALMAVDAETFAATLWGCQRGPLAYHEDIELRTSLGAPVVRQIGPGTPQNEKGEYILAANELESLDELELIGASDNLAHGLFTITSRIIGGLSDLWQGDTTNLSKESLYEYSYPGAVEPTLVGVKNHGSLGGSPYVNDGAKLISDCGTELGGGSSGSTFNAISASGEVVFFTALACGEEPKINELYARIDGEVTVALSEPVLPGGASGECTEGNPCYNAEKKDALFEGASEDGSCIFFLSEQPLVDGAPANGLKLYDERLQGGEVVEVVDVSNWGTAVGMDPEVQGVVRAAETGERVYFVAKGKLTGADQVQGREPEEAEPQEGANNLYVYESDPSPSDDRLTFVGVLLSPSEEAGLLSKEVAEEEGIIAQAKRIAEEETEAIVQQFIDGEIEFARFSELLSEVAPQEALYVATNEGARGPSGTILTDRRTWQPADDRPAQATPNGDALIFLSSAHLTSGDTSSTPQLFEYRSGDASLMRVSIGTEGGSSGNVDTFRGSPHLPAPPFAGTDLPTAASTGLAISEDGARAFFTSMTELASQVQPHTTNVYEFTAGKVYLISGGNDSASATNGSPAVALLGIDPSGSDVFFTTSSELVPQDGETQQALYDARENGGFPGPPPEVTCAEECRGAVGTPSQSMAPNSTTEQGGDNVGPPPATSKVSKRRTTTSGHTQKLAVLLKACTRKKSRRQRARCQRQAHKRYGSLVHKPAKIGMRGK